jgi:hypothetical protein
MKSLLIAFALLLAPLVAHATCPSYPYTLTNGQTADANQVMANLNSIATCVNSLPSTTFPVSVANGGTGAGTASGAALNLGVFQIANNLSEVPSPSTALSNLGGLSKANNLSDLTNVANARAALVLGGAATLNVGTTAGTVAAGNDSRFLGPTQSAPVCPYTLALTDAGSEVYFSSGICTVTIPANGTVAFAVGTKIEGVNDCSAGTMTLAITTDTLEWFPTGGTGTRTIAACSIWQLTKIATTKWVLTGVGIT